MIEPRDSDEIWGFWNRLREYMINARRMELLHESDRRSSIACLYLQLKDEREVLEKRIQIRDQTIRNAYLMCLEREPLINKNWPRLTYDDESGFKINSKACFLYLQKFTDSQLIEDIKKTYHAEFNERKRKGLIK